jgi:flavorubredoxin
MMPFRKIIQRNVLKLEPHPIDMIAPSHGPIYPEPAFILDAYRDWIADAPKNVVVVPYVSTHGSTAKMVEVLVSALVERGIKVHQFDLAVTDIGKLAIALVDAATIVIGAPTIHVGPHPIVAYAALLANALRPKLRFASIIGSYGWNTRVVEQIAGLIPNLKVELLEPVLAKGYPGAAELEAVERLADGIAEKHRGL